MTHEIVFYRFRPEVPHDDAVHVVSSLDAFLRACPGFVRRHTLHDEGQRTWIDVVEWASLPQAQAAAEAFPGSTSGAEFAALAEHASVRLFHAHTVSLTSAREAPLASGA